MSNTAVLFNALQPQRTQPSLHSHHHTVATPTSNIADSKMYNHSNSPSRRHRGTTTSTSVGTFVTKSTHSTNDSSIRRGADIVRKHIQQQQQHVMLNSSTATAVISNQQVVSSSSAYRMEPSQRTMQPGYKYDVDDDEILLHDSEEEVTTEDHISVTSWSEYDALPLYRDHDKNGDSGRYPRRSTSASSVEVDPPCVDDWSIDVDLDDVSNSNNNDNEPSNTKEDINYMKHDTERNVGMSRSQQQQQKQQTVPAPIANYNNTTMLMMTQNDRSNQKLQPVGGFISSDGEEEEDEEGMEEEKSIEKLTNRDDFDDSNSDIVEINDALIDPFHPSSSRGDHAVAVVSLSSPSKISNKLLSTTTAVTNAVSNHTKEQRSPSNSLDPTNGGGSSSSGSDSSPYRHRTVALSSSPNSGIRKGYPLPFHIQESPPNSKKNSANTIKSNSRNGTTTTAALATNSRPSFFMDYDVDAYCGYNADSYGGDHDEKYDSPEKPVREVPINTPSTISNLSSPGMVQQPPQQNSTTGRHTYDSQRSSAIMLQYDQLLRDPAYLHAQNAGFIWQSIVGQHIRFPSTWWNGARGPPINTGYDTNNNGHHPTDANNIPWMYFGRHTIPDHPVLNQLVKCRASAGRLLLHVVVQDLMTRTPIQDIVIGCFHPNSKGIRSPNSPALKRYENCRDIWMAVRKRSHTAVAATDSLIYSPNHWENPNPSNSRRSASAYNYSISRSPLGSGQRVTNQNVRAVFGDKAPLETIFLSEDELYERLAARILQQQQQNALLLSSSGNNKNNIKSKNDSTMAAATTPQDNDLSPPLAILQELVFA